MRFALESEGYRVVEAGDGHDRPRRRPPGLRPTSSSRTTCCPTWTGCSSSRPARAPGMAETPVIVVTGMVSQLEELRAAGAREHDLPAQAHRALAAARGRARACSRRGRSRRAAGAGAGGRRRAPEPQAGRPPAAGRRLRGGDGAAAARRPWSWRADPPPDAILSDVLMPGMDGFVLCRAVRQDPRLAGVPVVLLSAAYVDEADQELARDMGADALLLRTPDLREAIEGPGGGASAPPDAAPAAASGGHERDRRCTRSGCRSSSSARWPATRPAAAGGDPGRRPLRRARSGRGAGQPRDLPQHPGRRARPLPRRDRRCRRASCTSREPDGGHRLQAQAGLPAEAEAEAAACFGHPEFLRRIAWTRQARSRSPPGRGPDAEPGDPRLCARLGHASVLVMPFVVARRDASGVLVLAADSQDFAERPGSASRAPWPCSSARPSPSASPSPAAPRRRPATGPSWSRPTTRSSSSTGGRHRGGQPAGGDAPRPSPRPDHRPPLRRFRAGPVDERPRTCRRFQEAVAAGGGRAATSSCAAATAPWCDVDFSMSIERDRRQGATSCRSAATSPSASGPRRRCGRRSGGSQHVVSSSPAVLYSLRLEGETFVPTWVSENVERLARLQRRRRSLVRTGGHDHLHPEDREAVLAEMPTLLARRATWPTSTASAARTAAIAGCRGRAGPAPGRGRQPLEVVGSWSDVTARRKPSCSCARARSSTGCSSTATRTDVGLRPGDPRLPGRQRRGRPPLRLLAGRVPGA